MTETYKYDYKLNWRRKYGKTHSHLHMSFPFKNFKHK